MIRFAQICEAIAATTLKSEKVRVVAEYLRSLPRDDAARAALFLAGRAFPRNQEKVLGVGGSMVWQMLGEEASKSGKTIDEVYRRHGDLGDAAKEILSSKRSGDGLTLAQLQSALTDLAERRGSLQKRPLLEGLLRRASALEAKYLIKIITGDLRIGLKENLVEEAVAEAFECPPDGVKRANMLTGDIAQVLRLAAGGRLADANLQLFHPIGFMLASPAQSAEEIAEACGGEIWVEDKYDGIRAQTHKQGDRTRIFSRTLDEAVEFHELIPHLQSLSGDFVLDGEIVGWREGRPLPFTELQRRLGRKEPDLFLPAEVPVSYLVFDLLYLDGQMLYGEPLRKRRQQLEKLVRVSAGSAIQPSRLEACQTAVEIQQAFEAALERGNEGLMAKVPDSFYTPGRRGRSWLKLKRPMATLDVVVTAVEFGHGKRRGLLSDYTFAMRDGERLVNIGKAYSGLTDREIRDFTEYFRQHTIEDSGFQRRVEPKVVLEVAFNNIQRSRRHESGFALRFPRIVRVRDDKPVQQIDTLERVRELYEKQSRR